MVMHMWIVHSPASPAVIYKCCFNTRSVSSESWKKYICDFHLWTGDSAHVKACRNLCVKSSSASGWPRARPVLEMQVSPLQKILGIERWGRSCTRSWCGRQRPHKATSGAFLQLSLLSRLPEHKSCKQNKEGRVKIDI